LERHLQGGALVPSAPTKMMVHFYSADALLALTSGKTELETSAPPKTTWLVHLRQVHPLKLHG